ncbi:hypothetical protein D9M68_687720 [compost metagenome]
MCRAEQIGQYRDAIDTVTGPRAGGPLEQYRGAAGTQQPVADFGHFQVGRDRAGDAAQFAHLLELADKVAQVFVLHSEFGCGAGRVRPAQGGIQVGDDTHTPSPRQKNQQIGVGEIVSFLSSQAWRQGRRG